MRISDWSSDVCSSDLISVGTTDGVAAFVATQASGIGDAVTSLGSTLTLKILSDRPIFAPAMGVYSHRLGERWLAGGASNSGGAALLAHFSAAEIAELSAALRPDIRSEEHTSELQSLMRISYAVFCLKKKTNTHRP